jgi:hypothetical protein
MSQREKYVIYAMVSIFLIGVVFIVYTGWKIWREAEDAAYLSCLGSVMTAMDRNIRDGLYQPKEYVDSLLPKDANWRVLIQSEVDFLAERTLGGDCSNYSEPFTDRDITLVKRRRRNFRNGG